VAELAKLRFSSTFVVWACRMLRMGEKVVWYHHWALDRSPVGKSNGDHCYISPVSMGERLGVSTWTIEEYRAGLRKLGLLTGFRRAGMTNMGWVASLPYDCIPQTEEIAGPGAVKFAIALDLHLKQRIEWLCQKDPPGWKSEDLSDRIRIADRTLVRQRTGGKSDASTLRVSGRGVRGEGTPASEALIEDQLPPAVKGEDGVGAFAPESEDGGREPTVAERRAMAEEAERDSEENRRKGWDYIRANMPHRKTGT
jgi:hypothetical protein